MEINENKSKNKFYLLITSVYGKNNSGTLIRSASAFNCEKIFILGKDKKILKKFFGDHGTVKKMHFEFFESIEQIKEYCLENKIFICGIDIKYNGNFLFITRDIPVNSFINCACLLIIQFI